VRRRPAVDLGLREASADRAVPAGSGRHKQSSPLAVT